LDILLVSKHEPPAERKLIEQVLAERQVGIRSANSYKKAIEDLVKHKCAIVILYCFNGSDDLKATETVRIMKEIVPTLLIIAISEETPLETERELRKQGLYFHLTSPIEKEELKEVLSGAIEEEKRRRKQ